MCAQAPGLTRIWLCSAAAGSEKVVSKTRIRGFKSSLPRCTRFAVQIATGTGYVPNTMLVLPLERGGEAIGVLSLLDRRDGGAYGPEDVVRANLFSDLAEGTDELNLRGDSLMTLAEVMRSAGASDEAATAFRDALELYEAKGNLVSAERARAMLDELIGALG